MSVVGKAMELLTSKGVQDVFTVTGEGAIFLDGGLGKAYDMEFLSIDSKVNLEKRLRKIMESTRPFVSELMLDPNQPQIPKAVPPANE